MVGQNEMRKKSRASGVPLSFKLKIIYHPPGSQTAVEYEIAIERVGVSVIDLHVDCKCRKSAPARDIKNETPFTELSQKTEE